MNLTKRICMEVASHEALIRQAYYDSVGVLTWNVGMTNATGHNVERYIRNPAPLQHCMNLFVWALEKYAAHVDEVFDGYELSEEQKAAALSFTWNLGAGALKKATWVKRWKAGDIEGARRAFMWFNKPAEIKTRRERECRLFFDGVWHGDGTMLEYTKVTAKLRPNWKSGKRVDVSHELGVAMLGGKVALVDSDPYEPDQPSQTLSEVEKPQDQPGLSGFFDALIELIIKIFGGRK